MIRQLLPLCFAALVLAAEPTPAPMEAMRAAETMKLPEGFRATLFAAEPDLVQPVSFCIDDRGRLWVAEATNYGEWKATGKDRLLILEDADGDGRAEKRTVFFEGFNYITGIEVGFGGVWVMSPPCLYFLPDRNGDDKPDGEPEVVFDGFGHKESRHNLANGFTWGPDGWLYGGHGRTSPSDVGKPGTAKAQRVHCDGGVYRVHPTRRVFEVFADGTTNPWGVDFDDFGQCFVSNCVNPHLFHMIRGGHYEPWRNRASSQNAYQRIDTIADHLHYPTGKPGEMRGETDAVMAMGGGHAHCGTLVYLGDQFPAEYRNSVFMCNVHGKRINRDLLKPNGSGYTASHGPDFALSADPWFMGVTLKAGPDGSVFVSDWSDTGECHTYKPDRRSGRIFKISYGQPKRPTLGLAAKSDVELAAMQSSRNEWFVRHSRRLLQERAAAGDVAGVAVQKLQSMLSDSKLTEPQRLRALWALHVIGGLDDDELLDLLDHPVAAVRGWTIQLATERQCPERVRWKFAKMARDEESPTVRLHLASAMQTLSTDQRWPIMVEFACHNPAVDPNLSLMTWYAMEPLVVTDRVGALRHSDRDPLVRRFVARRIAEDDAGRGDRMEAWADGLLTVGNDAVRRDWMLGAMEGFAGRKSATMPRRWDDAYTKLAASEDAEIRLLSGRLALLFGDPRAEIELTAAASDPKRPVVERTSAIDALVGKGGPRLPALLQGLLSDKDVRGLALRGLAAVADEATASAILKHWAIYSSDEKAIALETLAGRKTTAAAMVGAMEQGAIAPSGVTAFTARQIASLGDAELSKRFKAVWGEIRDTPAAKLAAMKKLQAALTPKTLAAADVSNGRALFLKTCQSCHKLYGEGGTIGPDITGGNRNNLEYLLSNLVDPSAEVAKDFRMSVVSTKNERVVTGIVVERTAAKIVVQTATDKVTLAAADIDEVRESAVSLMPDGQLDPLKPNEVRDLIAYLMARQQVDLPGKR